MEALGIIEDTIKGQLVRYKKKHDYNVPLRALYYGRSIRIS
jgi:hypothetical protein